MEFRKEVMTTYMWDSKRDTDVKNRLLDSVGEGEGEMIWENSIETCILSYVKQITSPGLMHETSKTDHQYRFDAWDMIRKTIKETQI